MTSPLILMSPLVISIETSKDDHRADIAMYHYCGWTTGMCIMPLIFWAAGDWVWFMVITTVPFGLLALYTKYMIESPIWLATQGKVRACLAQLNKIARINGKDTVMTEDMLKHMLRDVKSEKVYGVASLFSSWRLAKNTVMACILLCSINLTFYVLMLNSMRIGGNPFMNFFYQGIVEIPSYFMGKWVIDRVGRRCTNVFSFLVAGLISASVISVVENPDYNTLVTVLSALAKLVGCITFFSLNVQSMEIFPTCLRQTGVGFCSMCTALFGVVGPYIVYLGTEFDMKYPYVIICEFQFKIYLFSNKLCAFNSLAVHALLHLLHVSP